MHTNDTVVSTRMLSKALARSRLARTAIRQLHEVPALSSHEAFAQKGIEGLFSAEGYTNAWSNYQKYLNTKLSLLTTGTMHEGHSAYQILLLTAKRTTEQHIFHYASQAHNNHFFFQQLADKLHASTTRPSRFLLERASGISTLEELKLAIIERAEAATGQGWVFLVETADKKIELITCHNDGTPYYYGKNQSLDMNGNVTEADLDAITEIQEKGEQQQLDFTLPLFAVNFWDVAYYTDFGFTGKLEYLHRVFDCVDWDVVNKRMFQV